MKERALAAPFAARMEKGTGPMMKTFHIEVDGRELPVVYNEETLAGFRTHQAGILDRTIRFLSDKEFGRDFYLTRTNRLGVVAPLLFDAIENHDGTIVRNFVLWLLTRFPEIAGIEIEGEDVQFIWDEPEMPNDEDER
ncbi:MAG: hypothetical protein OQJ76_08355, partial [Rhodospirillales bacterium]|nr:hypothetical protein [Rhodospirillales bacterium]